MPAAAWAQAGGFEYGSYVPADSPRVRHFAELKLRGSDELVVRSPKGKNLHLTPAQVSSFVLTTTPYLALTGVKLPGSVKGSKEPNEVTQAFVQQVDSGQVRLWRYTYSFVSNGNMYRSNGMVMGGPGGGTVTIFILSRAGSSDLTLVDDTGLAGNNKHFQELLRPYLAGRPDLLKYLDEQRLTEYLLPDLIHAVNTKVSYLPPSLR